MSYSVNNQPLFFDNQFAHVFEGVINRGGDIPGAGTMSPSVQTFVGAVTILFASIVKGFSERSARQGLISEETALALTNESNKCLPYASQNLLWGIIRSVPSWGGTQPVNQDVRMPLHRAQTQVHQQPLNQPQDVAQEIHNKELELQNLKKQLEEQKKSAEESKKKRAEELQEEKKRLVETLKNLDNQILDSEISSGKSNL